MGLAGSAAGVASSVVVVVVVVVWICMLAFVVWLLRVSCLCECFNFDQFGGAQSKSLLMLDLLLYLARCYSCKFRGAFSTL